MDAGEGKSDDPQLKLPIREAESQLVQKPGESARNERETLTSERESLARGIGAQAREEDFQATQNAGKLPAREESEDKALGSERGPLVRNASGQGDFFANFPVP